MPRHLAVYVLLFSRQFLGDAVSSSPETFFGSWTDTPAQLATILGGAVFCAVAYGP
jgi:hypothetical protein